MKSGIQQQQLTLNVFLAKAASLSHISTIVFPFSQPEHFFVLGLGASLVLSKKLTFMMQLHYQIWRRVGWTLKTNLRSNNSSIVVFCYSTCFFFNLFTKPTQVLVTCGFGGTPWVDPSKTCTHEYRYGFLQVWVWVNPKTPVGYLCPSLVTSVGKLDT